jgi:hypothetical protein
MYLKQLIGKYILSPLLEMELWYMDMREQITMEREGSKTVKG